MEVLTELTCLKSLDICGNTGCPTDKVISYAASARQLKDLWLLSTGLDITVANDSMIAKAEGKDTVTSRSLSVNQLSYVQKLRIWTNKKQE